MTTCELVSSKKEVTQKLKTFDFNEFKKKYEKKNVLTKEEILKFSKEEILTEGEKEYLRRS